MIAKKIHHAIGNQRKHKRQIDDILIQQDLTDVFTFLMTASNYMEQKLAELKIQ